MHYCLLLSVILAAALPWSTATPLHDAAPIWLEKPSTSASGFSYNQFAGAEYVLFRQHFRLSRPLSALASAQVHITAQLTNDKLLGAYKLWVDDQPVANGPGRNVDCKPFTDPMKQRCNGYQGYDVIDFTDILRASQPSGVVVAIQAYHCCKQGAGVVQATVDIQYNDGSSQTIPTGPDWQAYNATQAFVGEFDDVEGGPPNEGVLYHFPAEFIDMRHWPNTWRTATSVGSQWANASVVKGFYAPLLQKSARHIRQFLLPASSVREVAHQNGLSDTGRRYVVDLGRELQGGLRLHATAPEDGWQVEVRLGETLMTNGSVRYHMSTGNRYREVWTLAAGENELDMGHEYKEFRWAEVLNYPGELKTKDVGAWCVRYPIGDAGYADAFGRKPDSLAASVNATQWSSFSSSSSELNEVWELARYTIEATSLDVNTDSNTRQRDNCEMDAFIAMLGQLFTSNETQIVKRTLEYAMRNGYNMKPGWTEFKSVTVLGAAQLIMHDPSIGVPLAEKYYSTLVALSYIDKYFDSSEGLVVKGVPTWQAASFGHDSAVCSSCEPDLVDYPPKYLDQFYSPNNRSVVNQAYAHSVFGAMAFIAMTLGHSADATRFTAAQSSVVAAMGRRMVSHSGLWLDGDASNHSAVASQYFPAAFGVTEAMGQIGDSTINVKVQLDLIENKTTALRGTEPACSCMGGHHVLQALYRLGASNSTSSDQGGRAADMALAFLTSNYTWRGMIRQGATTTMEVWTTRDKPNLSWSHPWCSAPANAIPRLLMGVSALLPGFARILIAPQPGSLVWASLSLPTRDGTVGVRFNQTKDALSTTIVIPTSATARVCLPAPHGLLGKSTVLSVDGAVVRVEAEGRLLCTVEDIGTGKHSIVRTATDTWS